MKTRIILVIVLFFTLQNCKKADVWSSPLSQCTIKEHEGWYVERTLKNVRATVIKQLTSDSTARFLILPEDEFVLKLSPCNMPESFKIADAKVIVSGNIYNHPLMNFEYFPLELRAIDFSD